MNKKMLPVIIGVIALLVIGGGAFAFTKLRGQDKDGQQQTTAKKRVADELNKISLDQRPYITLTPEADGHNITLKISEVKKAATTAEYELEYQSGSLLQGAFGELQLATLPVSTKIFLGSCSAGGKCSYHEDIKGGSLLTRYEGTERYALKSDWRYFDLQNMGTGTQASPAPRGAKTTSATPVSLASKDAKFQLESSDLSTARYAIVFNTAGFPGTLEGTPVSDIFSLQTSAPVTGKAKVTIRANEEGGTKIMGWNGKTWQSFTTAMDGKSATAEVELMEAYLVTK